MQHQLIVMRMNLKKKPLFGYSIFDVLWSSFQFFLHGVPGFPARWSMMSEDRSTVPRREETS
jgi:hypothetical protein